MRVRITYTVEVPDWFRREINRYYGLDGLADRAEIKRWFEQYGTSMDDDLAMESGNNPENRGELHAAME